MPSSEKSHAVIAPLQVLGASADHRDGEVRLFVRTDGGNALLGFSVSLARQIGHALIAPPAAPIPGSKTGVKAFRSAHRAQYMAILATHEADPTRSFTVLCREAGVDADRFFAWRSYQKLIAKAPAIPRRDPVEKPSGGVL